VTTSRNRLVLLGLNVLTTVPDGHTKFPDLEPGIACVGGGETATAAVVADGVAAVVTVAITK